MLDRLGHGSLRVARTDTMKSQEIVKKQTQEVIHMRSRGFSPNMFSVVQVARIVFADLRSSNMMTRLRTDEAYRNTVTIARLNTIQPVSVCETLASRTGGGRLYLMCSSISRLWRLPQLRAWRASNVHL